MTQDLKVLVKRFLKKGVQVVIETNRIARDDGLEKYASYIERIKTEVVNKGHTRTYLIPILCHVFSTIDLSQFNLIL